MRQSSRPSTSSFGAEWEPDSASAVCRICSLKWGVFTNRRHHCRKCGRLVCNGCSKARVNLSPADKKPSRTCDDCLKPPPPPDQPFVRVKTRIPFSDDSPTVLGSPEALFRKSLIADHARVASVIEETEKSLLLDLSNRTGNDAAESALLDVAGEEEEADSEEEEEGTPGSPMRHLLNLEEMSSHLSAHHSQVSSVSPKSEGGNSFVSESTDPPPAALAVVKEGQVDVRTRLSVGKELRLSISKFGVMNFTDDDDEVAAPPSTMSFYEGSINTYPLSSDATLDLQDLLSPIAAPISASLSAELSTVEGTAPVSSTEEEASTVVQPEAQSNTEGNATAEVQNATNDTQAEPNNELITNEIEKVPEDASAEGKDHLTPEDKPKDQILTQKTPSSPGINHQVENSATKGTPKVILKGTPNAAPKALKLTPGLSPMPSGNTVRRLSTLVPRGSPYSTTQTVSANNATPAAIPVTPAAAPMETSAASAVAKNESAAVAGDEPIVADAASSIETGASFGGTAATLLFPSVESASESEKEGNNDTYSNSIDNSSTTTSAHTSVDIPTAPVPSPRAFSPARVDMNGVVSDTKKLKGGRHRNTNVKGRGLKM